jgi:hypothetical protein
VEIYTKYFCLEYFDILKYVKNEFKIKEANAPGSEPKCLVCNEDGSIDLEVSCLIILKSVCLFSEILEVLVLKAKQCQILSV